MPAVSAIVLAAGKSTRMGGPNKLLLPWGCSTVVGSVVGALRHCEVEIIVVTGRDAEKVAQAVEPVPSVHNENYEEGMGTSIAKGANACDEKNAILITLGDMPSLDSVIVNQLITNLRNDSGIVAPVYSEAPDRHGHPVLFGANYRRDLCKLTGDSGAKSVMKAYAERVIEIRVQGSLSDVNTTDDFK